MVSGPAALRGTTRCVRVMHTPPRVYGDMGTNVPGVSLVFNPSKFQDVTPSLLATLSRSEDESTNSDTTETPRSSMRDDVIVEYEVQ